jgi:hypothetical protein
LEVLDAKPIDFILGGIDIGSLIYISVLAERRIDWPLGANAPDVRPRVEGGCAEVYSQG